MRIDILTLFPEMFRGPFDCSIVGRARDSGLIKLNVHNIRDFALDKHRVTDDVPYGGGPGMVMKVEPIMGALRSLPDGGLRILMCPQGEVFSQEIAVYLSGLPHLVLICGHYEGVDERVRSAVDREISIGDYVLTGGEIPAMVVVDAVVRLIPGVLGKERSSLQDSFADGLLEGPQYTRPREFEGMAVPEVLLSGHHEMIRKWRRKQALKRTVMQRPDLLKKARLTPEDQGLLQEILKEGGWDSGPSEIS